MGWVRRETVAMDRVVDSPSSKSPDENGAAVRALRDV